MIWISNHCHLELCSELRQKSKMSIGMWWGIVCKQVIQDLPVHLKLAERCDVTMYDRDLFFFWEGTKRIWTHAHHTLLTPHAYTRVLTHTRRGLGSFRFLVGMMNSRWNNWLPNSQCFLIFRIFCLLLHNWDLVACFHHIYTFLTVLVSTKF